MFLFIKKLVKTQNIFNNCLYERKYQVSNKYQPKLSSFDHFLILLPGNTVTQFNRKKADCVQCVLSKYMLITETRLMKTTGSLNTKFDSKTNVLKPTCHLFLKWVFNRSPEVSKSVFVDCCCLLLW